MSCCVPQCQKKEEKLSQHLFPEPLREPKRHLQWIKAIGSEKLLKFDPYVVFKRFRVCRSHFPKSCFNGDCKKLLTSAVPSLNLPINRSKSCRFAEYEAKVISLLKSNSIHLEDDSLDMITVKEQDDLKTIQPATSQKYLFSDTELLDIRNDEDFLLMEVVSEQENQTEFTIVMPPSAPLVKPLIIPPYLKSSTASSSLTNKGLPALSKSSLARLHASFYQSPKKVIAQNIFAQGDLINILSPKCNTFDEFSSKIDLKLNADLTNSFYWHRSAFVMMRILFMKQWNLEEFEFSQAHFYYWDKIERSYFFLNNIIETAKRNEPVDGRLGTFLLSDPIGDGGQWDMIVNIINKHGLMPKKNFPENFSLESSARMNAILKSKLREYAKVLRDLLDAEATSVDIQAKVEEQMAEIFDIVGICMGIPPTKFTWEYYDKNNKHFSTGSVTPVEFYEQYVKPFFNVNDKVCLVTDPRSSKDFGKGYTVDCLGNVVGGRQVLYNNQPVEVLIDLITKSLRDNEAVLFACDLQALSNHQLKNFDLICNEVKLNSNLTKLDRIILADASNKSFMLVIGAEENKFLINNLKLSLSIANNDLADMISSIVIDTKYLSDSQKRIFNIDPLTLDRWDCMGELCE